MIIEAKNISKKYNITHQKGGYVALRDVLTNIAKKPFTFLKQKAKIVIGKTGKEEFWALKDINFSVKKGEAVGIIGANGAGKSTLLKILSQITPPTTGEIIMRGKVASLLEVGTGFHPELTGRENIFLNGAILGMKKKEIEKKFDEIVKFAGVKKFLDVPVKRYSSGMHVRLAFSVAAHMEPDILLVDEVLAVGDAEFQKKCLGKMDEVTKKSGRTILFVSHNMSAIQNLCKRCILLEDGKIKMIGETKDVINSYLNKNKVSKNLLEQKWDNIKKAPGNENAKLLKASVCSLDSKSNNNFTTDTSLLFNFCFYNLMKGKNNLDITFHLTNENGILILAESTAFSKEKFFKKGKICGSCIIPSILNKGTYIVNKLILVKEKNQIIYIHKNVLIFNIINSFQKTNNFERQVKGVIRPKLKWNFYENN